MFIPGGSVLCKFAGIAQVARLLEVTGCVKLPGLRFSL
jgi:hypothetical protein